MSLATRLWQAHVEPLVIDCFLMERLGLEHP